MSEVPSEASGDELPKDLVFLLTPAFDIHGRIDAEELIEFVVLLSEAVDASCSAEDDYSGIQVACALLPRRQKLVEFQVQPTGARTSGLQRLAAAIEELPVPEVAQGPVAFLRQTVFGARQDVTFSLPFTQHFADSASQLLDDALMRAVSQPAKSLWNRLIRRQHAEPRPHQSLAEDQIVPSLSRRVNKPVIVCNGRMAYQTDHG